MTIAASHQDFRCPWEGKSEYTLDAVARICPVQISIVLRFSREMPGPHFTMFDAFLDIVKVEPPSWQQNMHVTWARNRHWSVIAELNITVLPFYCSLCGEAPRLESPAARVPTIVVVSQSVFSQVLRVPMRVIVAPMLARDAGLCIVKFAAVFPAVSLTTSEATWRRESK